MLWVGVCDISRTFCDLWGTGHAKYTRIAFLNGQIAGDTFAGKGGYRN